MVCAAKITMPRASWKPKIKNSNRPHPSLSSLSRPVRCGVNPIYRHCAPVEPEPEDFVPHTNEEPEIAELSLPSFSAIAKDAEDEQPQTATEELEEDVELDESGEESTD